MKDKVETQLLQPMRNKSMNSALCFIGCAAMFWLTACEDAPFFHENHRLEPATWAADQPQVFEFQVNDTTQAYDFFLHLRHGQSYPYSNLYLFVELDFPNGKKSVDTLECVLADTYGRWSGKSTGQLVDHRIQINQRKMFPLSGRYAVRVYQAMRVDPLPEVYDLGFSLENWKPVN